VTDDEKTMTLAEAAARYDYTVLTLRAEANRGRLGIYKIGRRFYTTPADIKRMVELCRVQKHPQGSIFIPRDGDGLSATDRASSARDALKLTIEKLKNSSVSTSQQSTGPRRAETR
jgi:hypothetical protein